jgi:hypothetical protein
VMIVRRLSAVALQCALLAMSLVGSGYVCGVEETGATHMAMNDMSMPDMPDMPGMPSHSPTPSGDQSPADSHSDCSLPWAVGGGCQSMVSCSPNAIGGDARADVVKAFRAHDAPAWRADQLRSVTRSPEPPPPRA